MRKRPSTGEVDAQIGASLREIRRSSGTTQEQVAAVMVAVGHTTWRAATVSALESGKRNCSLDELADLCNLLGTAFLIGGGRCQVDIEAVSDDIRANRLARVEDAVVPKQTPGRQEILAGLRSRYGRDLLDERDARVASGQAKSATWATRSMAQEATE